MHTLELRLGFERFMKKLKKMVNIQATIFLNKKLLINKCKNIKINITKIKCCSFFLLK